MKISVVIPTVRAATLRDAVRSVERQTHAEWELVIVAQGDDAALARALAEVAARDARIRVLRLVRRGVSRARNAGVAVSTADVIALLDDDCEARGDWLASLSSIFDSEPHVDVVGGALLAPPGDEAGMTSCPRAEPREILYVPSDHPRGAPVGFDMLTANMAFRRRVHERVGGFDEHLGPGTDFPAGEDPDFVLRLEAAGTIMRSTPRAVVFHTHGRRHGVDALRLLCGYAAGQGALAAKLDMMNDARGRQRLRSAIVDIAAQSASRIPNNVVRAAYLLSAYGRCRSRYRVDRRKKLLEPR